ncbi:MAG: YcgN family cysteine cluster protein [Hyphomonadaceae bacterium]|nr:YcgN family cysteine cluster protein [Hyphomonadaceae bacterium]
MTAAKGGAAKRAKAEPELPFWKTKTLAEMNPQEWESLCDGCGKCCLIGLEDADTGEIYLTDVACKQLDSASCQCKDYANRKKIVPDCVRLTPKNVPRYKWIPKTCAYRLVSEGKELFWWHPLVSGDRSTVHQANVSVRGKTRPEGRLKVQGLMKRITKWPQPIEKQPAEKPPAKVKRKVTTRKVAK